MGRSTRGNLMQSVKDRATWCSSWIWRMQGGLAPHLFLIHAVLSLPPLRGAAVCSYTGNTSKSLVLYQILQIVQFSKFLVASSWKKPTDEIVRGPTEYTAVCLFLGRMSVSVSMSVCVYICVYVYVSVYVCFCIYIYVNVCVCTYFGMDALQHTAICCNSLEHTATHCNTLQHTATHCNTLQHTATHCNTL